MDIISGLPDEVLCHTLSFLTSKEAALTSLLSKRWRDLFAFSKNLRFEEKDNKIVDLDVPKSFSDFVDRVLAVSGNSPVKTFSLKYPRNVESARINLWIRNVLSRGGGVLDLLHLDVIAKGLTPLPVGVFTCKTLITLKLGRGFAIPVVPETASLPALKTLFLERIRFYNLEGRPLETLLSACLVLEELTILSKCKDHGKLYRTVACPTLKRLTLGCKVCDGFTRDDFRSNTFDTPSLTYLHYKAYVPDEYPIVNLDSLVEAKLNLSLRSFTEKSNPTNLIKGLRNVQILNLSTFATCEIFCSFSEAIPVLENLSRLSIETNYKYWKFLPLLLKKSPNLQTLVIQGSTSHNVPDYKGYECSCGYFFLLSCPVKVLEINKFWGTVGELGHLQRLLENLPCLELVKVYAGAKDKKVKLQLATDLLMLHRAWKIQLMLV